MENEHVFTLKDIMVEFHALPEKDKVIILFRCLNILREVANYLTNEQVIAEAMNYEKLDDDCEFYKRLTHYSEKVLQ